jgi:hypothetical protein
MEMINLRGLLHSDRFELCKKLTERVYRTTKNVQEIIPVYQAAENGTFQITNEKNSTNLYDRVYLFTDINYKQKDASDRNAVLTKWSRVLNALNAPFKLLLINQNRDFEKMKSEVLLKKRDPAYNEIIDSINGIITEKVNEGQHGIEQVRYFVITTEQVGMEEATAYFQTVQATIISLFAELGSTLIPLTGTERFRLLHSFYRMGNEEEFSWSWDDAFLVKKDWRSILSPMYFHEHKTYMEMEDRFVSVLFFRSYGSSMEDDLLTKISGFSFRSIISIDISPEPKELTTERLSSKYMNNQYSISKQQEALFKQNSFSTEVSFDKRKEKEDLEEYMEGVRNNNQKYFYAGVTITLTADSLETLRKQITALKTECAVESFLVEVLMGEQKDALDTALPIGGRYLNNEMRGLFTNSLVALNPFNSQELHDEGGRYYGINQSSGNVVIGNRRLLANGNGVILGKSGGGKSSAMKIEMAQNAADGEDDIILIDPMNEYKEFIEKLGGQYINLDAGTENHINPMAMPPVSEIPNPAAFRAEKQQFLMALYDQILGQEMMKPEYRGIIDLAVNDVYCPIFESRKDSEPTLVDFLAALEKIDIPQAQKMALDFRVFVTGNLNIFAHKTNVDMDSRIIAFGIRDIGEDLRSIAMLVMLEAINTRIRHNARAGISTWLYIDEFHVLAAQPYSAAYLNRIWKEVRKEGGFCTGSTQNVTDLLDNPDTKTMIGNSEFIVLMGHKDTEIGRLSEELQLSGEESKKLVNSPVGTGLVKFGGKTILIDMRIPKDTYLYELINTNFHEIVRKKGRMSS